MNGQLGEWLAWLVISLALCLALASGKAFGGPIATEAAAAPGQAAAARERVKALAERPELARQLQALGIAPAEAQRRVDAMSDTEVAALAGRLDALPAGGALSNEQLVLIVLLVVLILILI
jgi:hypothetical protein